LGRVTGSLPELLDASAATEEVLPTADVFIECFIASEGHVVDGPIRSALTPADGSGASWGGEGPPEVLPFVIKVLATTNSCPPIGPSVGAQLVGGQVRRRALNCSA
jgi:hypothetical protein